MRKFYFFAFSLCGFFGFSQQPPLINVNIPEAASICVPGECTTLQANYPTFNQTTSYSVQSLLPYQPVGVFYGWPIIGVSGDDTWSPIMNLPFNFSFYGNTYNQIMVGSNGVITFDLSYAEAIPSFCPYTFNVPIPDAAFPIKNAIYGVYQDQTLSAPPITDVYTQNINYFIVDEGIYGAPNRMFVINFSSVPLSGTGCGSAGLQTTQIVLYEGHNIIDTYVENRTPCPAANNGNGVLGIQNADGTLALTPPGRNTGTWTATHEAWRFTPNGPQITGTLTWLADGLVIAGATENPLTVCPEIPTTFSASVHYTDDIVDITKDKLVAPVIDNTSDPSNIILCTDEPGPFTFDLTTNEAAVLSTVPNPLDYFITYHETYLDALSGNPSTIVATAYSTTATTTTIFMRIEDYVSTACVYIKSFDLQVNPVPDMPIGATNQTFTAGETVAALDVIGQNIQWYDVAEGGSPLVSTTPLVSGMTYYATQTVASCESRMVASVRLAVTVIDEALEVTQFSTSDIRLYPNPAANSLNVSFPENVSEAFVFNVIGQSVLQMEPNDNDFKLDISSLNSGTYFIKVKSESGTVVSKFIKK